MIPFIVYVLLDLQAFMDVRVPSIGLYAPMTRPIYSEFLRLPRDRQTSDHSPTSAGQLQNVDSEGYRTFPI